MSSPRSLRATTPVVSATARGYRQGENPARWRGHLDQLLPAKISKVKHRAALPYDEMPAFIAALRTQDGVSARVPYPHGVRRSR